ncbi:hypothetical protein AKJ47_01725 [candidate division MSBL1 archaeon SCGC-AAA261G05]|uniref:Uncharacterized protein n=1 Tax=candidate division MSBL1 archaeon SCGC-AAA261G05 TaxID=1698276 RepID=A0A133VBD3_9EURY|nr:hypothetical protein AKJ47_01725 [candidate division MSBL1 archaeon SCGC-AAA261G05]
MTYVDHADGDNHEATGGGRKSHRVARAVQDQRPEFVIEETGLEELDIQEIHRHRYTGQYTGKPSSHYLGGSDDITFGNGFEISECHKRMKKWTATSTGGKNWRDAYHQIGFIADRLDLPDPVREDISRAYKNLRERRVSEAYSLEKLLGLLTYLACRIHEYPRDFGDIEEAIGELYDLSVSRDNVSKDMVKAFNKGPIRFGVQKQNGRRYLRRWKRIDGKQKDLTSLGRL